MLPTDACSCPTPRPLPRPRKPAGKRRSAPYTAFVQTVLDVSNEVVAELVELVEGGQEVGAGTVDAILGAIDQAEDVREIFSDVVWSHRGKKITPKTVTQ